MNAERIKSLERDAWEKRVDKRYEEVIEIYSVLFDETLSSHHLFNRATTYLEMGNYLGALKDFEHVTTIQPPEFLSDSCSIFKGICHWYLWQMSYAVESWKHGLSAPYTDAAGGVQLPSLLLYAAERLDSSELRREALHLLRRHARRRLRGWPGDIVPFLLQKMDATELTEKAKVAGNEILTNRWQCQADFYIALQALRQGDWMTFRSRIGQVAENSAGFLEPEYYLARWELQHNFPSAVLIQQQANSERLGHNHESHNT